MPAGTHLTLTTEDADIAASGEFSKLQVRTTDGDVRLEQIDGDVDVQTHDGDVSGSVRDVDSLTALTGDGDVDLRFVGEVAATTVRTGDGDVELTAPDGLFRFDLRGKDVRNDLTEDPAATRSITVSSNDGDVELGQ